MNDVSPLSLQQYLTDIEFPTDKQNIIDHAREKGADDNIISALEKLSDDTYDSSTDVINNLT